VGDVIELGSGYGTFTIPAASRLSGLLTTLDIEAPIVERARQRAAAAAVYPPEGPVVELPPWHYGLRLRRRG
jgi:hypothetical protein